RSGAADFRLPTQILDSAVAHLRYGDWQGASAEYAAAIRVADSFDRWELRREREWLRRSIDTDNDPLRRRWLAERDHVLHDMERAPGFTRANFGLLLIRMGHFAEGFGLISSAAQLDPEMRMDPNFRRHLAMAIGYAPMSASISTESTIFAGRIYSPPSPV